MKSSALHSAINEWEERAMFFAMYATKNKKREKALIFPHILDLVDIKRRSVLDFGCGVGTYCKLFKRYGARVTGYDVAPTMIRLAKKINSDLGITYTSRLEKLRGKRFDYVYCSMVLVTLPNYELVPTLSTLASFLKKGGKGILINTNTSTLGQRFSEFSSKPPSKRRNGAAYKTSIRYGNKQITVTDHYYTARYLEKSFLAARLKILYREVIGKQYVLHLVEK